MLLMYVLSLLGFLLKYSLFLTIAGRLLLTAFGWEFGLTKRYLCFLEKLFCLGQKRIERRLQLHSINDHQPKQPQQDDDDDDQFAAIHKQSPQQQQQSAKEKEKKLRRISTPDGPPVFLLDEYDDDDADADCTAADEADADDDDDMNNSPTRENRKQQPGIISKLKVAAGCGGGNGEKHEFHLDDAYLFVVRGLSAVTDDQVTKRFTQEELKSWNLLTRTNAKNYQFMSRSLVLFWLLGFLIRYAFLMPLRIVFTLSGFIWLTCTMALVGLLPETLRDKPYCLMSLMSFRMLACGITTRLKFHNRQNRAKKGDVCVANHTSPIDVVLLACDNCYALVGQRHSGLLGILEHTLSRATNHVWFDRGKMRDRQLVTQRLREHVNAKTNLPVLIFPEGTCINNSAVMMFRKGTFEATDRVCPVALKYDSRFGDPFWNSSKQSYVRYLLLMMSSWAIKCDVWYLPPMERQPGETSVEFANRVKAEIARQGGLDDLAWDGQLKRYPPKELWMHKQQEDYARRLKLQ